MIAKKNKTNLITCTQFLGNKIVCLKMAICVSLPTVILITVIVALPSHATSQPYEDAGKELSHSQVGLAAQLVNNVEQETSAKKQHEPIEAQISTENLYRQALRFTEKGSFDEAWANFKKIRNLDRTDFDYRRAFITFAKLYSIRFDLEAIEKIIETSQKGNLENTTIDSIFNEAQRIRANLSDITIEDKVKFAVFLDAKGRLLGRLSKVIVTCDTITKINTAVKFAMVCFNQGNYRQELEFLREATKKGWDDESQLTQCQLFINGLNLFDQKEYEQAEKAFSKIDKTDRHYQFVPIWQKKIEQQIFERNFERELDDAWTQLDWAKLKDLTVSTKQRGDIEKTSHCLELLNNMENILSAYNFYLIAKEKYDCYEMAVHLKQIKDSLDSVSENKKERYLKAQKWAKAEWDSLVPMVKKEIKKLKQYGDAAWENYNKNPITDDEIKSWTATSDYGPVMSKVEYLQTAHQNLSEASKLASEIDQEIEFRQLLYEAELLIFDLCKKIHDRAYRLDNDYQNFQDDLAKKYYEIVATMPVFEKNTYPNQARRRLENLQK